MSIFRDLRDAYLKRLCTEKVLGLRKGVLNIADVSSDSSKAISAKLIEKLQERLGCTVEESAFPGQTLGTAFATYTKDYLDAAFNRLQHIRPGNWFMSTSQSNRGIGAFNQYAHLVEIQRILIEHPNLKTALGSDYLITPDIVVGRHPVDDAELNSQEQLFATDELISRRSPLRKSNTSPNHLPTLHASISCKWTMRSDRAQNTRTEALNLIRNRKGNAPHIVVVSFEPLPTRLASIALGTGDVDCTYHAALDELIEAARETGRTDQLELLNDLINGQRLRDISDLPLDLAV